MNRSPVTVDEHVFIVGSFSRYRNREGAGEPFSNQRSEKGAARLAGT